MSGVVIRPETPADIARVRMLLEAAFGNAAEADLVDALRAEGDLVLTLVAERDGEVAGYVAFPRLVLALADRQLPVVGLAPLAVARQLQRQGVGGALVRDGLRRLRDRAEGLVFVLGDEHYYRRFGFGAAAAAAYLSPNSGPHFQVLRLSPHAPNDGTVHYPRAFAVLG